MIVTSFNCKTTNYKEHLNTVECKRLAANSNLLNGWVRSPPEWEEDSMKEFLAGNAFYKLGGAKACN